MLIKDYSNRGNHENTVLWISGHFNVIENELADIEAKIASEDTTTARTDDSASSSCMCQTNSTG